MRNSRRIDKLAFHDCIYILTATTIVQRMLTICKLNHAISSVLII